MYFTHISGQFLLLDDAVQSILHFFIRLNDFFPWCVPNFQGSVNPESNSNPAVKGKSLYL